MVWPVLMQLMVLFTGGKVCQNHLTRTATVLTRWKKDGDVTDIPRAGQNSGANLNFSTWYVENGDYLRVKNISVGYNLPAESV